MDVGVCAVVPEVISCAFVGYFPLMASLPLGGAEARENNQRHWNIFYSREVGKRNLKYYSCIL